MKSCLYPFFKRPLTSVLACPDLWNWQTDYNGSDLANTQWLRRSLRLGVPTPVDDVPSRRGDVDGVQDGPQDLAKRSRGDEGKGFGLDLVFRAGS